MILLVRNECTDFHRIESTFGRLNERKMPVSEVGVISLLKVLIDSLGDCGVLSVRTLWRISVLAFKCVVLSIDTRGSKLDVPSKLLDGINLTI